MDRPPITPEEPRKVVQTIGPSEAWYCKCRDHHDFAILRSAAIVRCGTCGTFAPWLRIVDE